MTAIFFAFPPVIVYDCRRRHSRRPEACYWWRRRPRWIWSQGEGYAKRIWYWFSIKVRAARKAWANHRPSFSNFLLWPQIQYQLPSLHQKLFWPSFFQFFTNGGHSRTPGTAWCHASDMTSPRRHRPTWNQHCGVCAARFPCIMFLLFCLCFTCRHTEQLQPWGHVFSKGGGSVTSVPRISASLHPFDTCLPLTLPF